MQEFEEFDPRWKDRIHVKRPDVRQIDVLVDRKYYFGLEGYRTKFTKKKKSSECDNACEKQGFRRGSWREKKFWRVDQ